ncbi:LysM peptidoglycan-binding domain-containing protein [Pseudoalteromonas fenneropenaei]|uniref:LysM peptidoglycan-binding domain-containing protein n=1 Tax=Pseudoalteromonas fenneropenaei TaxID=1737459 RepID=A0ABV7CL81_9GAMM
MKSSFVAWFFAAATAFAVQAEQVTVKSTAPQQYVVKQGDTLWDISSLYLASPWRWQELWQSNPQIKNPDLIYPGDVLALVYDASGVPQLQLVKGVKKLSPTSRVALKSLRAIPTLPMNLIEPYLTYEIAMSDEDVAALPIVLGANRNVKMNTQGQLLYIKGDVNQQAVYGIYRLGEHYRDLQSQQVLARETKLVATVRAVHGGNIAAGTPASVAVETVKQEIRAGDVLMPLQQLYSAQFKMSRPSNAVQGQIVATNNQLREFSTMSIVVLNLGKADEVNEGHILDIQRQSPTVIEGQAGPRYIEDANSLEKLVKAVAETFGTENSEASVVWTMPKEKVGELMIFKVFDKVSYALVTKTREPLRVGDYVVAQPN